MNKAKLVQKLVPIGIVIVLILIISGCNPKSPASPPSFPNGDAIEQDSGSKFDSYLNIQSQQKILPVLFLCLTLAYVLSWVFNKFGLPRILSHILVGMLIGLPIIKDNLIGLETHNLIASLANLGLVFLLFFIGLNINVSDFMKFSKRSIHVSTLAAMLPFIFGFTVVYAYSIGPYPEHALQYALIVGACLAITAEAVAGALLEELGMLNSKIGKIIIEAGIMDDLFEIFILTGIASLRGIGAEDPTFLSQMLGIQAGPFQIFIDIFLFAILIYIVRFFFVPITLSLLGKKPTHSTLFTASFIIVLLMAAVSDLLQLGMVLGAIIAGVIVKQTLIKEKKEKEEKDVLDLVETITFGFLEPMFFIWIGLQTDLTVILREPVLVGLVTAAAFAGKLGGSMIGNKLGKGSTKEGALIGWGMNARGAVELIAIGMARQAGLLDPEGTLYSVVVFMALLTTIISPIIFKWLLKRYQIEPEVPEV